MRSAGSNAYECIRIKVDTLVPICVSTTDGMAYSCFSFSHWGDTNTMYFFFTAGHWWLKKDAANLTAGTQKLFPRSFRSPDYETHWWWRVQLTIRFQVKQCCENLNSVSAYSRFWSTRSYWHLADFFLGFTGRGSMVFAYNAKSICGSNMAWIPHWTDCKHSANFQGGTLCTKNRLTTGYVWYSPL